MPSPVCRAPPFGASGALSPASPPHRGAAGRAADPASTPSDRVPRRRPTPERSSGQRGVRKGASPKHSQDQGSRRAASPPRRSQAGNRGRPANGHLANVYSGAPSAASPQSLPALVASASRAAGHSGPHRLAEHACSAARPAMILNRRDGTALLSATNPKPKLSSGYQAWLTGRLACRLSSPLSALQTRDWQTSSRVKQEMIHT